MGVVILYRKFASGNSNNRRIDTAKLISIKISNKRYIAQPYLLVWYRVLGNVCKVYNYFTNFTNLLVNRKI